MVGRWSVLSSKNVDHFDSILESGLKKPGHQWGCQNRYGWDGILQKFSDSFNLKYVSSYVLSLRNKIVNSKKKEKASQRILPSNWDLKGGMK
jgi:hypothetical protein